MNDYRPAKQQHQLLELNQSSGSIAATLVQPAQHVKHNTTSDVIIMQTTNNTWLGATLTAGMANHLFILASSYGIAHQLHANWCILNKDHHSLVNDLIYWRNEPAACPSDIQFEFVSEEGRFQHFEPKMILVAGARRGNVQVGTYLQSFKYFKNSGLPFSLRHIDWALQWVSDRNINVGIHVRRGDMLLPGNNEIYNVPSASYFKNAIRRLKLLTAGSSQTLKFVVCTDDLEWVRSESVFQGMTTTQDAGQHPSAAQDMSILAACQFVIMSVGTFGWWAAFLKVHNDGYTLYYDTPFKTESNQVANVGFDPEDHFPAKWIPVSGEGTETIISLVVPFRNRDKHRQRFIQHFTQFMLSQKFILVVYFVLQHNSELFNRGRLFNVGFKFSANYSDCVVLHDIDMLPAATVDYTDCKIPIQLSSEISHWKNSVPYNTYTGGVISAAPVDWLKINGLSNNFVGWGGEDDELYFRFKFNNFLDAKTNAIRRPSEGKGTYFTLNDADHTERIRSSSYGKMLEKLEIASRGNVDFSKDGISTNQDKGEVHDKNILKHANNFFSTQIDAWW